MSSGCNAPRQPGRTSVTVKVGQANIKNDRYLKIGKVMKWFCGIIDAFATSLAQWG